MITPRKLPLAANGGSLARLGRRAVLEARTQVCLNAPQKRRGVVDGGRGARSRMDPVNNDAGGASSFQVSMHSMPPHVGKLEYIFTVRGGFIVRLRKEARSATLRTGSQNSFPTLRVVVV